MAGVDLRPAAVSAVVATLVALLLTSCCLIHAPGEGGNGVTNTIDTEARTAAVIASSASVEEAQVKTIRNGFSLRLYVRPVIAGEAVNPSASSAELGITHRAKNSSAVSFTVDLAEVCGS